MCDPSRGAARDPSVQASLQGAGEARPLTGRDFIVFADNWGRHPSSTQHLFRHILRNNRVLWVHTIGLRNPGLSAYDLKRSVEILRRFTGSGGGRYFGRGLLSDGHFSTGNPVAILTVSYGVHN